MLGIVFGRPIPGFWTLPFLGKSWSPQWRGGRPALKKKNFKTVTEAVGSEDEVADSQSLKTASARLDGIRKEVHEAFKDKEDAPTPAEPDIVQEIAPDAETNLGAQPWTISLFVTL